MKKIMFNDRYGLTKAVLEGRKTMTRRIVPDGTPLGNWEETVKKSRYKVGDVVAVAQPYKDVFTEGLVNPFVAKAGWNNKMFVAADRMPHQIRVTDVRLERLQEICYQDCVKEGVWEARHVNYSSIDGIPYSPIEAFAALIDKVSGKGTWQSNPWVFVYEFELVK